MSSLIAMLNFLMVDVVLGKLAMDLGLRCNVLAKIMVVLIVVGLILVRILVSALIVVGKIMTWLVTIRVVIEMTLSSADSIYALYSISASFNRFVLFLA